MLMRLVSGDRSVRNAEEEAIAPKGDGAFRAGD
jgi:hypothetical protein